MAEGSQPGRDNGEVPRELEMLLVGMSSGYTSIL